MTEDFCDEDVLGHVYGFKAVVADSGVGASQVAWFPGLVQGAESGGNVFGELRAGGGVDGIGAREAFEIPEPVEGLDDLFWVGQDGNRVRLETCAWGVAGFELALEDESGVGEFLGRQALKKDLGRSASGQAHIRSCFLIVVSFFPCNDLFR